jgi:hypothetical protein
LTILFAASPQRKLRHDAVAFLTSIYGQPKTDLQLHLRTAIAGTDEISGFLNAGKAALFKVQKPNGEHETTMIYAIISESASNSDGHG